MKMIRNTLNAQRGVTILSQKNTHHYFISLTFKHVSSCLKQNYNNSQLWKVSVKLSTGLFYEPRGKSVRSWCDGLSDRSFMG